MVVAICLAVADLIKNLTSGTFYYVDFGRWFFAADLMDSHLAFCFDNLSLILAIMVLILTLLAQLFGVEYMFREAFTGRLLYLLNMFATSVIVLFSVYDFFLVLIVWELIGLFSFLLVIFYSQRIYTIKASLKTFIFSRISDLFIFLAFNLSILVLNTTDLSLIFLKAPFFLFHVLYINSFSVNFLSTFTMLIALAGVIKAAQFFFHVWLPDAMEAPTPASALIHSSTLVIMGIYLIVRFSVIFEFTLITNYFLTLLGGATIAFGAVVASFQTDIKKLVAYSTISQMGYLVCGCGFCTYEEVIMYLIMHAANKAFLFIIVGYTIHFFSGNTDLRQIGSSYMYSFDVCVFFFTISVNLIGLPYSAGFFSKEFLLFQVLRDEPLNYLVRASWLVSFCFTPFYMFLLTYSVLFGAKKGVSPTYYTLKLGSYVDARKESYRFGSSLTSRTLTSRYQYSLFSSRFSSLILLVFWVYVLFSGEGLLLILFSYDSPIDSVYSSFFLSLKSHAMFSTFSATSFTADSVILYVVLFTAAATTALLYPRQANTVGASRRQFVVDLVFLLLASTLLLGF